MGETAFNKLNIVVCNNIPTEVSDDLPIVDLVFQGHLLCKFV